MLKSKPLSSERQSLAIAIAERNAAQAELDVLNRAAGSWESPASQAVRRAREALDVAPAAIEKAKEDAATYLVAQVSGNVTPAPITVADALEAASLARDELAAAESTLEALRSRIGPAEDALRWGEDKVRRAVEAVLKASPEVAAVLDEVERAVNSLWRHGAVLQALWHASGLDTTKIDKGATLENSRAIALYHRLLSLPAAWQGLPPVLAVGTWDAAVKALHTDPNATLPTP